MFKKVIAIVTTSLMLVTMSSQAADMVTNAKIKSNFFKLGLQAESIKPSKMNHLYEVLTNQGLFYTDVTGNFLVQGKLYEITDGGVSSLTESSLAKIRVDGMEKFKNNMIIFPAENEKYQVTIFTDLTCGYCRKLHNQMTEYNDMGITIRYLAFPRNGLASQSYTDMRSVWCSVDQQTAMTNAKAGAQVEKTLCSQPIAEQYHFGRKIGVTGTPAIMLEDGTMIPGYQTPEQMQKILQSTVANKAS